MTTLANDNTIRKAAVLIRSLDDEAAAAVLARLSADEARALRVAVRELGEVSDDDRQSIADELRSPPPALPRTNGGVELAFGEQVEVASASGTYARESIAPTPRETDSSLALLSHADPATLVSFLDRESSQTVAVVLSCLPADRAAAVLAALPADRQVAVLDRLADLGDADPESLGVITGGLRTWIIEQQQRRDRRTQRLGTIEAILAAAPTQQREQLLNATGDRAWRQELAPQPTKQPGPPSAAVDSEDESERVAAELESDDEPAIDEPPSVSEPIEEPLLVSFADIERFPVSALAQVMRHAPADHFLLAIAGGSERFVQRLAGALPRRQAVSLRQHLAKIGPTRLRDIEQAQQSVAHVASDLLRRGWIRVSTATR